MKSRQLLAGALLALCTTSCGTFLSVGGAMTSLREGMTQDEVTRLMGAPDYRRFNENGEQWEYRQSSFANNTPKTILVDFINGKVASMNSFSSLETTLLPSEQPLPQRRKEMSEKAFQTLYTAMKKKAFKDERFELLDVGLSDKALSSGQCARLLSLFTFDDDKMQVLEKMRFRITDPQNAGVIADSFDSLFKRDEVRKHFGLPTDGF